MRRTLAPSAHLARADASRLGMLLARPGWRRPQPEPVPDSLGVAGRRRRRTPTRSCRTSAPPSRPSRKASTRRSSTCRPRATTPPPRSRKWTPARRRVDDANAAITAAQQRFDTFAAATYVNGPSGSYLTAADPADILVHRGGGPDAGRRARNRSSPICSARAPSRSTRSRPRGWPSRTPTRPSSTRRPASTTAVSALTQAQQTFGDQQAELDQLTAERDRRAGQARRQARNWSRTRAAVSRPPAARRGAPPADPGSRTGIAHPLRATGAPAIGTQQWDPTLPAIPSAFVSGDPIAIINAILRHRAPPRRR